MALGKSTPVCRSEPRAGQNMTTCQPRTKMTKPELAQMDHSPSMQAWWTCLVQFCFLDSRDAIANLFQAVRHLNSSSTFHFSNYNLHFVVQPCVIKQGFNETINFIESFFFVICQIRWQLLWYLSNSFKLLKIWGRHLGFQKHTFNNHFVVQTTNQLFKEKNKENNPQINLQRK